MIRAVLLIVSSYYSGRWGWATPSAVSRPWPRPSLPLAPVSMLPSAKPALRLEWPAASIASFGSDRRDVSHQYQQQTAARPPGALGRPLGVRPRAVPRGQARHAR